MAKYVKLALLINDADGDSFLTAEEKARWRDNVTASGCADGYTFAYDWNAGTYVIEDIKKRELERADVTVYGFMGSEYEQERFYARDVKTYRHMTTGELYIKHKEGFDEL